MLVDFRMTEIQMNELKDHLHNGDGLEAIAFGLCGRLNTLNKNIILLHELFLLAYEECEREEDFVKWSTKSIEHLLEKAQKNNFAIVKFHSHFLENSNFSELDDISDTSLFEAVYSWNDNDLPHLSIIMYPNCTFKGRVINPDLTFKDVNSINVIGENITKYNYLTDLGSSYFLYDSTMDRNKQAFGDKTIETLKHLKIGVVGCSGTGSPTIEQLVRLGVGELVLIDPDKAELVNMNRIVGLTKSDVDNSSLKVNSIKNHIEKIGLNTKVTVYPNLIQESQECINELGSCDVIFGCVDSAEGRHYLNLICHYYLVPLIDIGVKLSADGKGGIDSINGNIHYVFPGSVSLLERKVYTSRQLEEEEIKRNSPEEYENRLNYFDNIEVPSPAVISINMLHSSFAVCEMLSRIHQFRYSDNNKYASTHINLTDWDISTSDSYLSESRLFSKSTLGIGNKQPNIIISHE